MGARCSGCRADNGDDLDINDDLSIIYSTLDSLNLLASEELSLRYGVIEKLPLPQHHQQEGNEDNGSEGAFSSHVSASFKVVGRRKEELTDVDDDDDDEAEENTGINGNSPQEKTTREMSTSHKHRPPSPKSVTSSVPFSMKEPSPKKAASKQIYLLEEIPTENLHPVELVQQHELHEFWQSLDHPNIARLVEVSYYPADGDTTAQENNTRIANDGNPSSSSSSSSSTTNSKTQHHRLSLVRELCEGGTIFERSRCFSERNARMMMRQILSAVQYLHSQNIVHGDLRAEWFHFGSSSSSSLSSSPTKRDSTSSTITAATNNDYWKLQLINVTLARRLDGMHRRKELQQGPSRLHIVNNNHHAISMYTTALEVLRGSPPSKASDMWAVGVILYQMIAGKLPFGSTMQAYHASMRAGATLQFKPPMAWMMVSAQVKDLMQRLLSTKPNERLTVEEALNHAWLK